MPFRLDALCLVIHEAFRCSLFIEFDAIPMMIVYVGTALFIIVRTVKSLIEGLQSIRIATHFTCLYRPDDKKPLVGLTIIQENE